MNLQDRLQNLAGLGLLKSEKRARSAKDSSLAECLGGKTVSTSVGEYIRIEKTYGQSYRHGIVCLSDLPGADMQAITYLAGSQIPKGLDLTKTVFLDTETTGLAGGSGTYPFLVGVGYFESDRFVLEQFFMRDYGEEKALLSDLAELLEGFSHIVTYNGKGYDLPILKTRYILNRIKSSLEFEAHLDLLFPARRIWKQRVKDCSLSNLENRILGVERVLDIPSYLIPQAYFDFLRTGEKEKIHLILEHNACDIVSLAALLSYLCLLLESPDRMEQIHPEDLFSLGRQFFHTGHWDKASWCLEKSAAKALSDELYLHNCLLLGKLYKRTGAWEKAEQIWHQTIKEHQHFCLEPYLELAKFYEHRLREYGKALLLVERAIGNLDASILSQGGRTPEQDLYYRRARLKRKMGRAAL